MVCLLKAMAVIHSANVSYMSIEDNYSECSCSLIPRLSRAHGRGEGKKESLVHTDCACSGFSQKSVSFIFFRNSSVHSTYKYR